MKWGAYFHNFISSQNKHNTKFLEQICNFYSIIDDKMTIPLLWKTVGLFYYCLSNIISCSFYSWLVLTRHQNQKDQMMWGMDWILPPFLHSHLQEKIFITLFGIFITHRISGNVKRSNINAFKVYLILTGDQVLASFKGNLEKRSKCCS